MARYNVWKHHYDDEWILNNWLGRCTTEFCDRYVAETGHEVSKETLRKHIYKALNLHTDYYYTDEEVLFIKEHYAALGAKACADKLGISITKVYSIAHDRLGLKMSKEDFKRHVNVFEAKYPVGTIKQINGKNYTIKAEDGWHELGRYVWEQHNGKVPEGHYVVFLNRDAKDARIENLAVVPKGVVGAMNVNNMWHDDADLTKTHLMVLLLERAMKEVVV